MLIYITEERGMLMAYYFMTERKRGQYQSLNISSSKYFQTIPTHKKICAYTLKEIDDFTMMFDNIEELKKHLVLEEILPISLVNKPLSIRYLTGGKYLKVEYDFLYQKDLEYIYDPSRLISLILKRYYNKEFVFIKKLANNFAHYKECSTTAPEVARLAEASIYQGYPHRSLEERDLNGDTMITRFLKLLILKHYEKPNGKIDYKDEVNYRNLHDALAFVNNYDKKNQSKEEQREEKIETKQGEIKILTKTKSKKKNNYNIDGQMKFDV